MIDIAPNDHPGFAELSDKSHVGRRTLLASLALLTVAASPRVPRCAVPNILFVCRYGTAKSPIAREWFLRRASERGITATAFPRGLTIEDHISPRLLEALRADGIDPRSRRISVLRRADVRRATMIIAFDPPQATPLLAAARDWSSLPSLNADYPKAKDDLLRRIDGLLDELSHAHFRE